MSKAVGFLTADADDKEAKKARKGREKEGGLNGCSSKCNDSQRKTQENRSRYGCHLSRTDLLGGAHHFPFVWVVLNSFKPSAEVLRSSFSLPETFTWMNYQTAFERLNVLRAYRYSFVISGTVTVGVMVFASLMAFGLTRYHFKGKELIRSLIVASLMFPVFSTIIPVFKMMVEWGLLNKSIAVILPQIAGNLSFATIVMTGFMQSIPLEMEGSCLHGRRRCI